MTAKLQHLGGLFGIMLEFAYCFSVYINTHKKYLQGYGNLIMPLWGKAHTFNPS